MSSADGVDAVRREALACFTAASFPFLNAQPDDGRLQRLASSVWFTALKGQIAMQTSERHGNAVVKVYQFEPLRARGMKLHNAAVQACPAGWIKELKETKTCTLE